MTTDTDEPDFAALPALGEPVAEASRIWTTASHSPTRCAAVHCAWLPEVGHYPMKARN